MQMPHAAVSGETLVKEYGLYHQTRLSADKALKQMAESWAQSQARLKAKVEAYEAAQAATMTAMAVRDGEDAALDDAVRRFYGALLAKSNNNRKSPLFAVYFPDGVTAVVNAPMEAELQKVSVLLSKLAQEEDEELKAHIGPITAAMNDLGSAMDAHRAALDTELQTYGLVQQEKINWFDSYKLNHRSLAQTFYKEPKKADSYFKPIPRGKARKDNGGDGTPAAPVKN
ncbi:MAG: hypothetical protein WBS54_13830 [Acidobacteriota bacterium]